MNENENVTQVSAGGYHTCAIKDGQAYCWGLNTSGQLGDLTVANPNIPSKVSNRNGVFENSNVAQISAGEQHTCAIKGGAGYCWGSDSEGKLGKADSISSNFKPAEVR